MKAWILVAAGLTVGGCANMSDAVFVTKTSLSVLDVDTSPAETSIGFGRTEGYVGPRFNDGSVYPVTGFINARGAVLARQTQQVFAGGTAAMLIWGQQATSGSTCGDDRNKPPLFLVTGTSVGLRVGFVEGTVLPSSFNFGYRRKEATVVPVAQGCQPSVLATHNSDAGARQAEGVPKASLGIVQYIATGLAADELAKQPVVRSMFAQGAEAAKSAVQAFTERESAQLRSTVDTLGCAMAVTDAQFRDIVLVSARELSLFPEKGYEMVIQAAEGAPRRQKYAQLLQLRAGADGGRTVAMEIHKKRVCDLLTAD